MTSARYRLERLRMQAIENKRLDAEIEDYNVVLKWEHQQNIGCSEKLLELLNKHHRGRQC